MLVWPPPKATLKIQLYYTPLVVAISTEFPATRNIFKPIILQHYLKKDACNRLGFRNTTKQRPYCDILCMCVRVCNMHMHVYIYI